LDARVRPPRIDVAVSYEAAGHATLIAVAPLNHHSGARHGYRSAKIAI
jgi:hypothetical protein